MIVAIGVIIIVMLCILIYLLIIIGKMIDDKFKYVFDILEHLEAIANKR